jgi:uncharacterized protein (TIGR02594 family)
MINVARYLVHSRQVEALQNAIRGAPWMRLAYEELGTVENRNEAENNPRVLEYLQAVERPGLPMKDETSWCSGFANWCMARAGFQGTANSGARSWLKWGVHISQQTPCFGAVAVFLRGSPESWQGHVGFVVGEEDQQYVILGGNQRKPGMSADSVCISRYSKGSLLGFRWPTTHPVAGACRRFVAHRAHL